MQEQQSQIVVSKRQANIALIFSFYIFLSCTKLKMELEKDYFQRCISKILIYVYWEDKCCKARDAPSLWLAERGGEGFFIPGCRRMWLVHDFQAVEVRTCDGRILPMLTRHRLETRGPRLWKKARLWWTRLNLLRVWRSTEVICRLTSSTIRSDLCVRWRNLRWALDISSPLPQIVRTPALRALVLYGCEKHMPVMVRIFWVAVQLARTSLVRSLWWYDVTVDCIVCILRFCQEVCVDFLRITLSGYIWRTDWSFCETSNKNLCGNYLGVFYTVFVGLSIMNFLGVIWENFVASESLLGITV